MRASSGGCGVTAVSGGRLPHGPRALHPAPAQRKPAPSGDWRSRAAVAFAGEHFQYAVF